ncbi:MAG: hypothetical protein ACE5HF_03735 [Gemmatimonadota bacterium]
MTRLGPVRAWRELGAFSFDRLRAARVQLHVAAGMAGSVGEAHSEPEPDYGHVSLAWDPRARALMGAPTRSCPAIRAGLRPAGLELVLAEEGEDPPAVLPLSGRDVEEVWTWLRGSLADRVPAAGDVPLRRRDLHLPAADGLPERFASADTEALEELEAWIEDADALLGALRKLNPAATPVRCWPHHLDIATLIVLDPGSDPEEARSVGAGLSLGDEVYLEPYLYVNAWPAPEASRVEALSALAGGGRWHLEGWFGAVLTGPDLVSAAATDQPERAGAFVDSAVRACRAALGADADPAS